MKHLNRGRAFTLLELLAVIFIIAIVTAVLLPTMHHQRGGTSNRVKCGSNLRQIGQAILLYSNENKGNYPRTFYVPGAPPAFGDDTSDGGTARNPFGKDGLPGAVGPNEVPAAMFLLIRTQDITSEVFVCPSSNGVWDTYGTAAGANAQNKTAFSNWRKNMSYGLANPYPSVEAVNGGYRWNSTLGSEFAVAADMNPGIGSNYDATLPNETSGAAQMVKANSPNHQGGGENVLFGDGHVEFVQNPFAGTKRDNIYTVSGSTDGSVTTSKTVIGSPTWAGDTVILPTAN